jgi:hypothetical protein
MHYLRSQLEYYQIDVIHYDYENFQNVYHFLIMSRINQNK